MVYFFGKSALLSKPEIYSKKPLPASIKWECFNEHLKKGRHRDSNPPPLEFHPQNTCFKQNTNNSARHGQNLKWENNQTSELSIFLSRIFLDEKNSVDSYKLILEK